MESMVLSHYWRETPPYGREETSWDRRVSAETGDSPGWGQSIVNGEERK